MGLPAPEPGQERSRSSRTLGPIQALGGWRVSGLVLLLLLPCAQGWTNLAGLMRLGPLASRGRGQKFAQIVFASAGPQNRPVVVRGAIGRTVSRVGLHMQLPTKTVPSPTESRDDRAGQWLVSVNPGLVSNSLHDFHRNSTSLLRGLRDFTSSSDAAPVAHQPASLPQCIIHSRIQRLVDRELLNHAAIVRQIMSVPRTTPVCTLSSLWQRRGP